MNLCENEQFERPNFDKIITLESMGNAYKTTGNKLKGDPHMGHATKHWKQLSTSTCNLIKRRHNRLLYRLSMDPYIILAEQSKGCE